MSEIKQPQVGVGVFIFNEKGELFMMRSPKWNNLYVCPGGHVECGEKMIDTAKREVKEETNIDIDEIMLIAPQECVDAGESYQNKNKHLIFLDHKARAVKYDDIKLNEEGSEFDWRSPEEWLREKELEKYCRQIIEKYLISEKEDHEELYKRALADYQNLLKQTAKEKQEFARYANENLLNDILPVYDNLKIAVSHFDQNSQDSCLEGIKYIVRQFKDTLANAGIEEIKTVGEKFDHNTMEAMENVATEDKKLDDVVAKEIKAGYKLNGKVVSVAKVAVFNIK